MVRAVAIYSHFVLTFLQMPLGDLPGLIIYVLDPARACRLYNPVTFKSLDCFCRSWQVVIPAVWDTLPASLLLQGHIAEWRSVMKALQRSCY